MNKNKKLLLGIIFSIVGMVIVGISFVSGNLLHILGDTSTLSNAISIVCSKSELTINDSTTCTLKVNTGSYKVNGIQGKITISSNLTISNLVKTSNWNYGTDHVVDIGYVSLSDQGPGTIDVATFTIKGNSVGTGTISFGSNATGLYLSNSNFEDVPLTSYTKTIAVKAETPKSSNANLSSLKVDGTSVPNFNPNTTTYNVTTSNSSVNITATKADSTATMTGDTGSKTVNVGNNTFKIYVTAEDGTTKKTYTVNIYRKSNDATLELIKIVSNPNGLLSPSFSPNETNYTYTVDASATVLDLRIYPNSFDATTSYILINEDTGAGEEHDLDWHKSFELNIASIDFFAISVLAGDGVSHKTYNISINKTHDIAPPIIVLAHLSDLRVNDETVTGFDANRFTYNLGSVPYSTESVNVSGTKADETEIVTGFGQHDLNVGDNQIEIKVSSADTTVKNNYYINIHRKSNDATLSSLIVTSNSEGSLSPSFDPSKKVYYYKVAADEDEVTISAAPNHSLATVTGAGVYNPKNVSGATLTVTAEDGNEDTYSVVFDYEASTNAYLSDLTIDGATIDGFNPTINGYSITVPNEVESINIGATLADPKGMIDGTGVKALSVGTTPYLITVTAEDGTENVYVITVTREGAPVDPDDPTPDDPDKPDKKSNNAFLKGLTIEGGEMNPAFNSSVYVYEVKTDNDSINIVATSDDDKATISGNGKVSTTKDTHNIVVTAEDGVTKNTYVIRIIRSGDIVKCYLTSKVYNVDNVNRIISLVSTTHTNEKIISNLDSNCSLKFDNGELVMLDKYRYKIERVFMPQTGRTVTKYSMVIGFILLLMGLSMMGATYIKLKNNKD